MNEKLEKIAKQIEENEELKAKLEGVVKKGNSQEEYIAICNEYGIEINEEDLETQNEISDDELEAVTGGECKTIDPSTDDKITCNCTVGGGGVAVMINGVEYPPCACVVGGGGVGSLKRMILEPEEGEGGHGYYVGEPCFCLLEGYGFR